MDGAVSTDGVIWAELELLEAMFQACHDGCRL